MERIEDWTPKLFMAGAGIAIFTCLARPDYNLPLFIFAMFIWNDNDKRERFKLLAFLLLTFLVDFIWLCYWGPYWRSTETQWGQWEKGIHGFVIFLSAVGFVLKAAVIACVFLVDKSAIMENIPGEVRKYFPQVN